MTAQSYFSVTDTEGTESKALCAGHPRLSRSLSDRQRRDTPYPGRSFQICYEFSLSVYVSPNGEMKLKYLY